MCGNEIKTYPKSLGLSVAIHLSFLSLYISVGTFRQQLRTSREKAKQPFKADSKSTSRCFCHPVGIVTRSRHDVFLQTQRTIFFYCCSPSRFLVKVVERIKSYFSIKGYLPFFSSRLLNSTLDKCNSYSERVVHTKMLLFRSQLNQIYRQRQEQDTKEYRRH